MRYFLAFAATLGLVFLVLVLLFRGGGSPKLPHTGKSTLSYATTDAQARLTIDGPVNADQNHQIVQITVGKDLVTYQQIQGYQGHAVNTLTFANNENAYANFLLALARAGFTNGSNDPSLQDERGYCPLGDRYIFQFTQDGTDIERYWATNCGNPKTYLGNLNLTLDLFQAQVPNYSVLAGGLDL
jgi:hypothetical protein